VRVKVTVTSEPSPANETAGVDGGEEDEAPAPPPPDDDDDAAAAAAAAGSGLEYLTGGQLRSTLSGCGG